MPSVTEVVNASLRLLGATRITALTDGSTNANYASDVYAGLRDDLLRSSEWNFATKRQQLAQMATDPVYEYQHAFAVPSDWLKTIEIHDNDAGVGTVQYTTEVITGQRAILASREQLWMRYIYRQEDPNMWSVDFVRAMELALARDLAIPVAASGSLHDRFMVRAERALGRAKSADAMDSSPQRRPIGSWAASRGGRWPRNGMSP